MENKINNVIAGQNFFLSDEDLENELNEIIQGGKVSQAELNANLSLPVAPTHAVEPMKAKDTQKIEKNSKVLLPS
jgi:hypothetical protein